MSQHLAQRFAGRMLTDTPFGSVIVDRRTFLHSTAAAAIGVVPLAAADPKTMPTIDTHQHLWDLDRFRLPWLKPGSPLAHSHKLADYKKAAAGLDIVKTIYMEVDVDPAQQQAEADFVIATCKQPDSGMVAGVVSGRPAADNFDAYVAQFRDSPYVKGVRQVLHADPTPAGYCLDAKFVRGVRRLGELGLRFDLCMRQAELPDAAKLIDACPKTQFILDHCGNAPVHAKDARRPIARTGGGTSPPWRTSERRLQSFRSREHGQVRRRGPANLAPIVNHVLDSFGPDRVIFAGDWPVCTTVSDVGPVGTIPSSRRERTDGGTQAKSVPR